MLDRQAAPLREQAVRVLRDRIVSGDFGPGGRLKERALVEELRVSRTVVREALRQLESERLIRMEPQVGPVVSEISADQARQLYEVRAALESAAARLAAAHRTEEQLDELRRALGKVAGQIVPLEELLAAKRVFYDALIRAGHNDIIGEQLDGVQARISQLRRVTLSHPERGPLMIAELTEIVDAIAAHDETRAYDASVAHVMAASRIALEHLTAEERS